MSAFSAGTVAEPLVGEIVGLRTFRVDDGGMLLPLYSDEVWYDGVNTAVCAPPVGHHRGPAHLAPADDCECGFYAYGSPQAAATNKHSRHVRAVVACWGSVVAGTQGVRAEHARIVAVWLNPAAPSWLRTRVATRYPSARIYDDSTVMLAAHPLTSLGCYEEARVRPPVQTAAAVLGTAAALTLGALPLHLLHRVDALWFGWLTVTAAVALLTGWLLVGARSIGHLAAAFVVAGVLAWMLAPLCGLAGWALRVPVLRALLMAAGGLLARLRPHHFPVVASPRRRSFRGVPY